MLELKALLLTQGMHGMVSQVEGLAKALKLNYKHQNIKLKPFWNLVPPKLTPISENLLTEKFVCDSKVIISCGRKSVVSSIALKKRFGKEIFNIHIQDPKVSFKHFDLIISPEHDNVRGDNVITTKGAIHYLTKEEISNHTNYLKDRLNTAKEYFLLILGGPTKHYDYSNENISNIFNLFNDLVKKNNLQGIIVPSMRTPKNIIELAKNELGEKSLVVDTVDKKAYLSALSLTKYIVVTCDSTSMISEAAMTGKPIYVADIPTKKNDFRIKKFNKLFNQLNIIKKLDNKLETWHYENLDETSRIAKQIKKKLI